MKLKDKETKGGFIMFDIIGRIYVNDKKLTEAKDGHFYKFFNERKVKNPWWKDGKYTIYPAGYYHEKDIYYQLKGYNKNHYIESTFLYDCPQILIFDKSNKKIGSWYFDNIEQLNDKLKEFEPYFINNGISMNLEFSDEEKFILDENTECLS